VYLAGSLDPFEGESGADKKLMGAETTQSCIPSPKILLGAMFPHLEKLLGSEFIAVNKLGQDDFVETSEATDVMPLDEGGFVEFTGEALSEPTQYFCGICEKELANAYLRCKGCEQHEVLSSAFHVCLKCFSLQSDEPEQFWRYHMHHVQIRGRLGFDCPVAKCPCKDLLKLGEEKAVSAECVACEGNDVPAKGKKSRTKRKAACCIMSCNENCHKKYEIRFRFLTEKDFFALKESFCRVCNEK
jgi:hypothetical protein